MAAFAKPALGTKKQYQPDRGEPHRAESEEIAVAPTELRHVPARKVAVEVHSVEPCDEAKRHENRRDDGQDLHDFVHAHAHVGQMHVHEARGELSVRIESFHQLYRVIMTVSKENVGIAMGVTGVGPGHCAQDLTGWGYRAPQDAQIVTNGMYFRDDILGMVCQHSAFDFFQLIGIAVDHWVECLDDCIEHGVGEIGASTLANSPFAIPDPIAQGIEAIPRPLLNGDDEAIADELAPARGVGSVTAYAAR